MIDLTGSGTAAAVSPPALAERRDEGGPVFAVLLAQAAAAPAGAPMPTPVREAAEPVPMSIAVAEQDSVPIRRVAMDHAVRFDARGMIAMAAGAEAVSMAMPVVAATTVPDGVSQPRAPVVSLADAPPPGKGIIDTLTATASAMPVERVEVARPAPAPTAAPATATGEPTPAASLRPDEPEVAVAPTMRQRTRFATMAQGAPKVAVVALADGLAVSAAVGALPESERHRTRDAIAATLSRHGLRSRAITLLAMPATPTPMER